MQKLILKMALPALIRIIEDLIKSSELAELRERVLSWLLIQADRTETSFDDKLVENLVPLLFAPEFIGEFIGRVFPMIKAYVLSSATPWDDYIFIPILEAVEEVFAVPEQKA